MCQGFIYLDVCALCRVFDDQSYLRIRMETEAIHLILSKIKEGKFCLILSPVHTQEIEAMLDEVEKIKLKTIVSDLGHKPSHNVCLPKIRQRAEELVTYGFGIADAAHVAFAEEYNAEFITCDDKLIKKCKKYGIKVWCDNPLMFCLKENLQ